MQVNIVLYNHINQMIIFVLQDILVGCLLAIGGNLLISVSLNIQVPVHTSVFQHTNVLYNALIYIVWLFITSYAFWLMSEVALMICWINFDKRNTVTWKTLKTPTPCTTPGTHYGGEEYSWWGWGKLVISQHMDFLQHLW